MANDSLLKEAIADAKAVKETAIENAKMAIEEAFTPRLQSILRTKLENDLTEDEDPKLKESDDEDEDDEEGDKDKEDDEEMDESKSPKNEADDDEESDEDDDEEDEDDMDLESVIKELENEIKEIADTDQDPLDDDDPNDDVKKEEKVKKESADAEIDIEALIAEIEKEDKETELFDEEVSTSETISYLKSQLKEKTETLDEYKGAVVALKDKLQEINLLNAKLLYANKLFRSYELSNEQKVKVIETMDRTSSPREVKLVYATLAETFGYGVSPSRKQKSVQAIAEGASKSVDSTKPANKEVIAEGIDKARLQKLANILK